MHIYYDLITLSLGIYLHEILAYEHLETYTKSSQEYVEEQILEMIQMFIDLRMVK